MSLLFDANAWIGLLTLTALEIVPGVAISGRSLILIAGGPFLIGKATHELHDKLEEAARPEPTARVMRPLTAVVLQIMVVDIAFSLDSVITAVGMVDSLGIMIAAAVLALGVMLYASGPIGDFVERHPTVKMLALSFLVLIGSNLMAEGLGQNIPKGYTYFAMAFSVGVEMLNLRLRKENGVPARS